LWRRRYLASFSLFGARSKAHFRFPGSVPSRAGEEIRTPDVQLGKTRVTIDAKRIENPVKQAVFCFGQPTGA
jgi:hypothetical protein